MKKIDRLAADTNLDVYGLGKDKAKWDMRLEAYTEQIVQYVMWKYDQTRTEPNLGKFIMDGLKDESQ